MVYDPTVWVNNQPPDINAANLNKLEEGVQEAHELAAAAAVSGGSAAAAAVAADLADHEALQSNPHAVTPLQTGARGANFKNAAKRGALPDGTTDNTTILQTLLDEIRDAGRGELYLPGNSGTVYATKGLWVPPNCRIISDLGVKLKCLGRTPDARHNTGEPQDVYGLSTLNIHPQTQGISGSTFTVPSNIIIEGLTFVPDTRGDVADHAAGCIEISGGQKVILRDIICEAGSMNEAIHVLSRAAGVNENILLERCYVTGARRNGMAFTNVRYLTIRECVILNTLNDSPIDTYPPSFGIDFEPNGVADVFEHILVENCVLRGNSSVGIGFIWWGWWGGMPASVRDITVRDCYIEGNGSAASLPGGQIWGGIFTQGGSASGGGEVMRFVNNHIRANSRGHSLWGSTNCAVIVKGNDLRPASGFSAFSITGYDAGRSIISENINS